MSLALAHKWLIFLSLLTCTTKDFLHMKSIKYQLALTLFLFVLSTTTSSLFAVSIPQQAKVDMDGKGNMLAVWESHSDSSITIQGAYYMAESGSWSSPELLSLADANSGNPKIAINDAGQAVAVWQSVNSITASNSIYAATIALQGSRTWTQAAMVSSPDQSVRSLLTDGTYQVKTGAGNQAAVIWQNANQSWQSATTIMQEGVNSWNRPVVVVGVN